MSEPTTCWIRPEAPAYDYPLIIKRAISLLNCTFNRYWWIATVFLIGLHVHVFVKRRKKETID